MIEFKLASIFFVMLILISAGCVDSNRIGLSAAKTHALQEINNSMPTWEKMKIIEGNCKIYAKPIGDYDNCIHMLGISILDNESNNK